jgi:hypothetical protein
VVAAAAAAIRDTQAEELWVREGDKGQAEDPPVSSHRSAPEIGGAPALQVLSHFAWATPPRPRRIHTQSKHPRSDLSVSH